MLTGCRNVVGNLLWLQGFFKTEIRHATKDGKRPTEEMQRLNKKLKRRRLQRELALVERKLQRMEQQEKRGAQQ